MSTAEEELARAQEYRRMMQAREDNKLAREKALVAPATGRNRVYTAWAPLLRDPGWEPQRRTSGDAQ